jgi:hypothetical protein
MVGVFIVLAAVIVGYVHFVEPQLTGKEIVTPDGPWDVEVHYGGEPPSSLPFQTYTKALRWAQSQQRMHPEWSYRLIDPDGGVYQLGDAGLLAV